MIPLLSQIKTQLMFPGSQVKSTEEELVHAYEDATILPCTTPSGYQIGLLFGTGKQDVTQTAPPALASEQLYLLYFYGNGMCLLNSSDTFAHFRKLGFNVLIPEYLGYGMSSGFVSEFGCYETADVAYRYLTATLQVPPTRIVIAGWSLGAAVAIDLAARVPAAGLIALSPFTDMIAQADAMLPLLPRTAIQFMLRERFDNLSKMSQITCPIFIAHGTEDELVPFIMAELLAGAVQHREQVTLLPVRGCSHNDIFDVSTLWRGIRNFANSVRQKGKATSEAVDSEGMKDDL